MREGRAAAARRRLRRRREGADLLSVVPAGPVALRRRRRHEGRLHRRRDGEAPARRRLDGGLRAPRRTPAASSASSCRWRAALAAARGDPAFGAIDRRGCAWPWVDAGALDLGWLRGSGHYPRGACIGREADDRRCAEHQRDIQGRDDRRRMQPAGGRGWRRGAGVASAGVEGGHRFHRVLLVHVRFAAATKKSREGRRARAAVAHLEWRAPAGGGNDSRGRRTSISTDPGGRGNEHVFTLAIRAVGHS